MVCIKDKNILETQHINTLLLPLTPHYEVFCLTIWLLGGSSKSGQVLTRNFLNESSIRGHEKPMPFQNLTGERAKTNSQCVPPGI